MSQFFAQQLAKANYRSRRKIWFGIKLMIMVQPDILITVK